MSRNAELLKKVIEFLRNTKTFDNCLQSIRFISFGMGKCHAELTVDESHINGNGTLHGGLTATIVDNVTYYALVSQEGIINTVTTDLNVSFMKPAIPGDVITIDAKVCRAGQQLAFLDVELSKKDTGDLIARGQSTVLRLPNNGIEAKFKS